MTYDDDDYGYGTVTHEHRLWAYRLLLASLTGAHDAIDLVADEIGDCPHCWANIALYCAGFTGAAVIDKYITFI